MSFLTASIVCLLTCHSVSSWPQLKVALVPIPRLSAERSLVSLTELAREDQGRVPEHGSDLSSEHHPQRPLLPLLGRLSFLIPNG